MWIHRWLGLGVAWVVAVAGAGVVLVVPQQYMASARIYVDTQSILKPLMEDLAVQPNVEQQVAILSQTLISRPNVEKLIRAIDRDSSGGSRDSDEGLADRIIRNFEIKSNGTRDNLYVLAYRDPDPERAKWVVQTMLSILAERRLGDSRKDSSAAKKFIDDQIGVYDRKLREAENRLKEFKLRHLDIQIESGKLGGDQLADIRAEIGKAKLDLREAEDFRDALRRQMAGEEPSFASSATGRNAGIPIPDLDGRIDTQLRHLDALLQQYTEQHPDVVATRRVIAELEEQRLKSVAEWKRAAAANPGSIALSGNPIYQQLRISYGKAEASVASLRARVAEYEARLRQTTDVLKAEPKIEAEFAQLNRDYAVHKKNYETLVARREAANLGGELESAPGVDDFRLIDPPRVSPRPVAPNRPLLLSLALLFGLLAGCAASFAASRMRPLVLDAQSLREVTGLPLLGCISLLDSEPLRQTERADRRRFSIAFGGLVGSFSIGLLLVFMTFRTV